MKETTIKQVELSGTLENTKLFEEEGKRLLVHNLLPLGKFYHSLYGKVVITEELVKQLEENFKKGFPHYEIPLNLRHNDNFGKYGVIVDVFAKLGDDVPDEDKGLWIKAELSEEGYELIKNGKFTYLSAEIHTEYHDVDGNVVGPVLVGAALTNRPAHTGMAKISLSEDATKLLHELVEKMVAEILGDGKEVQSVEEKEKMEEQMEEQVVQKTAEETAEEEYEAAILDMPEGTDEVREFMVSTRGLESLPRDDSSPWNWDWNRDADAIINKYGWAGLAKACLYVDMNREKGKSGYPEVKAAYKFPVAKIKNGKLTLFWNAVRTAMAVVHGGRGGTNLPTEVKRELESALRRLYKLFGKEPPERKYAEEGGPVLLEEILGDVAGSVVKIKEYGNPTAAPVEVYAEISKELESVLAKLEDTAGLSESAKEDTLLLLSYTKTLTEALAEMKKEAEDLTKQLNNAKLEAWKAQKKLEGYAPAIVEKFAEEIESGHVSVETADSLLSALPEQAKVQNLEEQMYVPFSADSNVSVAELAREDLKRLGYIGGEG